jgi:hypothetical protein
VTRQKKIVNSVTTSATAQIAQFWSQCHDFAEQAAIKAAQSVSKRLANLTAAADLVCDELDIFARCGELSALCRELDQEVNALAGP